MVRTIVTKTMKEIGWEVVTAGSGVEALAKLEGDTDIKLISTDINMPEMDGVQLLEKVKADDRFKNIPVMMLTSHSDSSMTEQAMKMGASGYLSKPFTADQLKEKVKAIIG